MGYVKRTMKKSQKCPPTMKFRLITGVALNECLGLERYQKRAHFPSLWCSPANTPASHAGDHRSEAGQGRQFSRPQSILMRCTPLVWEPVRCNSEWGSRFRTTAVEPAFRQAS